MFLYLVCFFPPVMADVAVIVKESIFAVEVAVERLAATPLEARREPASRRRLWWPRSVSRLCGVKRSGREEGSETSS